MKSALATVVLVVTGSTTWAGVFGATSLPQAVANAEVIVVGQVTASSVAAPASSSVHVVRLLKGSPGDATITFRWSRDLVDFAGTQSTYGLLFLASNDGGWVAIPASGSGDVLADYLFAVPTGDLPPPASYPENSASLDKVTAELRHAAATDGDAEHLARTYAALLSLQGRGEPTVTQHVATLSLAAAASCPTAMSLQATGASLARTVRNRLIAGLPVPSALSSLLCETVDPGAVPAAAELLNTAGMNETTRRCAAMALRNVHSASALAPLAAALDSSDPEVAYTALMGLSAYAMGEIPGGHEVSQAQPNLVVLDHSPSVTAFEENPGPHLEYWRHWWKCEACQVGAPGCEETACLGYVATYAAQYDANWTCTGPGPTGCVKHLISAVPATYKPEPPHAPAPPADIYTPGYVGAYSSTYDAWTCTAGGANGCRKNRLAYGIASYSPTPPDAAVPPATVYTYGYVATWTVGGWSGCEPSCGPGSQSRAVTASSWKATAPDASRPPTTQGCNYGSCTLTCYDHGLYRTWAECYAEWPYCDIRYRDDGAGGLLQCKHGYE